MMAPDLAQAIRRVALIQARTHCGMRSWERLLWNTAQLWHCVTDADRPPVSARSFSFDLASEGGRFRVCYCVYASCVNNTDFVIDGGLLFVKGLTDRPKEARCKLGETCTIRTQGFGLNEMNDSVILVPQALGCGGAFVRVRGDRAPTLETVRIVNATHNFTVQRLSNMTLNGTYRRLPDLNEGRVQFRSQVYNQLLYYNTYWSRWILGPRTLKGLSPPFKAGSCFPTRGMSVWACIQFASSIARLRQRRQRCEFTSDL